MLRVAAFGVPGAIPRGRQREQSRPAPLLAETARRTAPSRTRRAADEMPGATQLLDRLRAVFGPGFLALPRFRRPTPPTSRPRAPTPRSAATTRSRRTPGCSGWSASASRSPGSADRCARPRSSAAPALELSVAQVPHVAGQRWVGLDAAAEWSAGRRRGLARAAGRAGELRRRPLRPARRRVDRGRAEPQRDDRHRLPVRPARRGRAAGDPARGAAGRRRAVDGRRPQPRAARDPRPARLRAVDPAALGDVGALPAGDLPRLQRDGDAVSTDLNPLAP